MTGPTRSGVQYPVSTASLRLTQLLLPRVPGLADALFVDGTMTKQEVRAATLAKLMPMRGALLVGHWHRQRPVAIEWMRCTLRTCDRHQPADAMAAQNALALGAPKLELSIRPASPEKFPTFLDVRSSAAGCHVKP
jgi:hypothetical protein